MASLLRDLFFGSFSFHDSSPASLLFQQRWLINEPGSHGRSYFPVFALPCPLFPAFIPD